MKLLKSLALASASLCATFAHGQTVTVNANDDLYNANGGTFDGSAPVAINVTGLSSITFAVSSGQTVTVNNSNYNDADGVGSVSGENDSGTNGTTGISGITTTTAGFLAGVFFSASPTSTAPASLDYTGAGATSFTSASPLLQQAFFIGDGLTGDGTGATQIFYVPTGATTLYLGLTDACGYAGGPSCYGDNYGSFTVTATGVGVVGAVPEPSTYALLLAGLGGVAFASRRQRSDT